LNFEVGDLVFVERFDVNGIILSIDETKETVTLDDLWNTKVLREYTLYKVLVQGKIRTLTDMQISKKAK
tara:strand:- start:4922 stop:5128 length:207 start_codon:yes stop_codon:yes gene_type:complete